MTLHGFDTVGSMEKKAADKSWQDEVKRVAAGIRRRVLEHTIRQNGGYLSQACSSAEIFASLYVKVMHLGSIDTPLVPKPFPGRARPGQSRLFHRSLLQRLRARQGPLLSLACAVRARAVRDPDRDRPHGRGGAAAVQQGRQLRRDDRGRAFAGHGVHDRVAGPGHQPGRGHGHGQETEQREGARRPVHVRRRVPDRPDLGSAFRPCPTTCWTTCSSTST